SQPAADEMVEEDERRARVDEALGTLTKRDREVLLLWDAGMSYPEIAQQTGLAVGAVGTTLARARKRLIDAHDRMEHRDDRAAHSWRRAPLLPRPGPQPVAGGGDRTAPRPLSGAPGAAGRPRPHAGADHGAAGRTRAGGE